MLGFAGERSRTSGQGDFSNLSTPKNLPPLSQRPARPATSAPQAPSASAPQVPASAGAPPVPVTTAEEACYVTTVADIHFSGDAN